MHHLKFFLIIFLNLVSTEEPITFWINNFKSVHKIDPRFVSFSIDPIILFTDLNFTKTTEEMSRHLAPCFIHLVGPSSRNLRFLPENHSEARPQDLVVTPSMWFGLNEWLASAGLTPVYKLQGMEGEDEMLELADKFNVTCHWQIECSRGDLLEEIRGRGWKIVGEGCTGRSVGVDSLIFEANVGNVGRPGLPLWLISEKSLLPVSFSSALEWARELGEVAKNGYDVVLRQPRLHELQSETPPFWISYFHKVLMGRNVLEVLSPKMNNLFVYAHCAKNQNDFIKSGAITLMTINNSTSNKTIPFNIGRIHLKNMEIQNYILTSVDSKSVYLNNERLTLDSLKTSILPKIRRTRSVNHLLLTLPAQSVSFFVLPNAQLPICVNEESEDLLKEIEKEQKVENFLLSTKVLKNKIKTESGTKNPVKFYRPVRTHVTPKKVFDLELTNAEIRGILERRARARAAQKKVAFNSRELKRIMEKATRNILHDRNSEIRIRKRIKLPLLTPFRNRIKRDINMELLNKLKPEKKNSSSFNKLPKIEEIRKTIRERLKPKVVVEPSVETTTEKDSSIVELEDYDCLQNSADKDEFSGLCGVKENNNLDITDRWKDGFSAELGKNQESDGLSLDYDDFGFDLFKFKRELKDHRFKDRYKSLTENLKEWTPSDIVTLQNTIRRKGKRSVRDNIVSVENGIENLLTETVKEQKIVEPKIDVEHGDYQLLFPNNDKIEVLEKGKETEVKLLLHETGNSSNNIQKIPKKSMQKIWQDLLGHFTKFFDEISKKVKKYIMHDILHNP